jgi:hypothetical protein
MFHLCCLSFFVTHGRWFSPVIPASTITKADCHDIGEILLKVSLNKINQPIIECTFCYLKSQARTHAVLVIGLYELLGNPTT